MDVTLVLTHRCNLGCGYCYAGEKRRQEMDDEVMGRAIGLLWADGAEAAQLSFFGGEPFLAFEQMKRATALAEAEAERLGKTLLLQCTTNGAALKDEHVAFAKQHDLRVTVSVDGIREAHEVNRPTAGGGSSFDEVLRGLRRLREAGVATDAMMVITPLTARYVYLSTSFLWGEDVGKVRANLALEAPWTAEARSELREQLESIGWELVARRLRGEKAVFEPFEGGMRRGSTNATGYAQESRSKLVVATTGHLYPCAPMVGEDRDEGPEATLRLGHLDQGADAALEAVAQEGVQCDKGGRCECAAYLETGDRETSGPMGQWYASVCQVVGFAVAESLANSPAPAKPRPRRSRRAVLGGLAAIVGGAAIGGPLMMRFLEDDDCDLGGAIAGEMMMQPDPMPQPAQLQPPKAEPKPVEPETVPCEPDVTVDGEMPIPEVHVRGRMRPRPIEAVEGDLAF